MDTNNPDTERAAQLALIDAFLDGKIIQHKTEAGWVDMKVGYFEDGLSNYRIKPDEVMEK